MTDGTHAPPLGVRAEHYKCAPQDTSQWSRKALCLYTAFGCQGVDFDDLGTYGLKGVHRLISAMGGSLPRPCHTANQIMHSTGMPAQPLAQ
jgi:hypothetical protein